MSDPTGIQRIAAERRRQIEQEGWTPDHDDEHDDEALAMCAAIYATPEDRRSYFAGGFLPCGWPLDACDWKPGDRIRELEKAGALIAAEIDRLLRRLEAAGIEAGELADDE
jgi:hypothetical protein